MARKYLQLMDCSRQWSKQDKNYVVDEIPLTVLQEKVQQCCLLNKEIKMKL